jgi:alcohol dehydrogenase
MESEREQHAGPSQSLAAVFRGAGQPLVLAWFPVPMIEAGEALVRVQCCTVCGSDLHTVTGKRMEKVPTVLGHEICGVIAETGVVPLRDIMGQPLQVGDRVTWSTSVSCGHCDRCLRGLPQKCRTLRKFGHESTEEGWALSGGLSQIVHLKNGTQAIKLPPDLSSHVVCPANCATATVAAACRVAGSLAGARVMIFGAGMLGLTAAAFARSHGAATVAICDRDPHRLALAGKFGAVAPIEWNSDPAAFGDQCKSRSGCAAFDILLELSGAPEAVEAACALGDVGARVVLVGTVMKSRAVQIDPENLVRRWISIHGVHNYVPDDLGKAVAFLVEHHERFPFRELVARTFPLEQVNAAVEFAIQHRPVRVAVVPE